MNKMRKGLVPIGMLIVLLAGMSLAALATPPATGKLSNENLSYSVVYDARTGVVLISVAIDVQANKIVDVKVVYPEIYGQEIKDVDILSLEKLEQLELGFYSIDNYPAYERESMFKYPEDLIFDFTQGRVRRPTEEEWEERYATIYSLNTGEIAIALTIAKPGFFLDGSWREEVLYDLGPADPALLRPEYLNEQGYGLHWLDNYPNKEFIAWSIGCGVPAGAVTETEGRLYIFDLGQGSLREMTAEEEERYYERLREKAAEAALVDVLRWKEILPDNRIRATLQWSTYYIYVETNSSVLGVKFNSTNKQLFIEIGGVSGTLGALDLIVPTELVPSSADVNVYLDDQPLNFSLTQAENNYYLIHAEYTHSTRTLTVNLIALPAWYAQPLNLALIALAVVIAIGAAYWFKFRR